MKNKRMPGATVWILLFFMTVLMCFPFIFYWKLSTTGGDILRHNRIVVSNFGFNLSQYFEALPADAALATAELDKLPLIPEIGIELYDLYGSRIAVRTNFSEDPPPKSPFLYRTVKSVMDSFREDTAGTENREPGQIKAELLRIALDGRKGVDYYFRSNELGDRYLFFSYPLKLRLGDRKTVKGVLLLESRDTSARSILQKQRNQFAGMCLIFSIFLGGYVYYVIRAIVLPIRKIVRRTEALNSGTSYLYPDSRDTRLKNEIGELNMQLDGTAGILESRDKEIKQHMSALKHIIRNPLAVIRAALEALMIGKTGRRDVSLADIIFSNLARIDNYISSFNPVSDLIDFEKPPEDIDLNRFLRDVITNYTALAKKKDIEFKFTELHPVPVWHGFYYSLYYAIEQVINNALDFSPEESTIHLYIRTEISFVCIMVSDQGPGIERGNEEEIFKQYFSVRPRAHGKHTGTGLYLSRSVLRRIGGNITVENNELGGAVFSIRLPLR